MTLRYETRSRVSTYTQSWVGGEPDFGVFESIATTVLSSSTSTITFSSIPSTYKHLQIRYMSRSASATTTDFLSWRFNSDSGSNYSRHYLFGEGASVTAGGAAPDTRMTTDGTTGATATSGMFGVGIVDILDYADTNKHKTLRALSVDDRNGSGLVVVNSGNWRSTSAVNTITIITNSTANFVQYSHFALYGIKG
jgi:hypothetical protein